MKLNVAQIKKDIKKFRHNKHVFKRLCALLESTRRKYLKTALVQYQVSERSFYLWKIRYLKDGVIGLLDKSGRGQKRNWIRGKQAKRIKFMRRSFLWGPEVIHEHLKRDHGIHVSKGRIYRFLRDANFINQERKQRIKNKHSKVVKIFKPGQQPQIDVKHLVHVKAGKKQYAYNFVDHVLRNGHINASMTHLDPMKHGIL